MRDPNEDRGDESLLSVVIVTYNESDRVRSCIESVISATEDFPDTEVILVDSNSSDQTVDIASEYPVTILRIPEDDLATPGAGRYVGTAFARGSRILFVDGDITIHGSWLAHAMDVLDERSAVGGVDGQLDEARTDGKITPVDAVRGVALYERAALESVGGFEPYLRSVEDIHLGYELREAGYTLLRLPEVAGDHPDRPTVFEPLRRFQRGYMSGAGQAVRTSLPDRGLVGRHLYRIRHRMVLALWLCIGLLSVLTAPTALLWTALSAVALAVLTRRLGLKGSLQITFVKTLGIVGFCKGFLETPRPAASYPLDRIEVVKTGPDRTASHVS